MTMQRYRKTPEGGLEPSPVEPGDYRRQLRSRRWDAAELANPEAEATNPWIAVAFILAVAVGTFVVLVLGYASGFWS